MDSSAKKKEKVPREGKMADLPSEGSHRLDKSYNTILSPTESEIMKECNMAFPIIRIMVGHDHEEEHEVPEKRPTGARRPSMQPPKIKQPQQTRKKSVPVALPKKRQSITQKPIKKEIKDKAPAGESEEEHVVEEAEPVVVEPVVTVVEDLSSHVEEEAEAGEEEAPRYQLTRLGFDHDGDKPASRHDRKSSSLREHRHSSVKPQQKHERKKTLAERRTTTTIQSPADSELLLLSPSPSSLQAADSDKSIDSPEETTEETSIGIEEDTAKKSLVPVIKLLSVTQVDSSESKLDDEGDEDVDDREKKRKKKKKKKKKKGADEEVVDEPEIEVRASEESVDEARAKKKKKKKKKKTLKGQDSADDDVDDEVDQEDDAPDARESVEETEAKKQDKKGKRKVTKPRISKSKRPGSADEEAEADETETVEPKPETAEPSEKDKKRLSSLKPKEETEFEEEEEEEEDYYEDEYTEDGKTLVRRRRRVRRRKVSGRRRKSSAGGEEEEEDIDEEDDKTTEKRRRSTKTGRKSLIPSVSDESVEDDHEEDRHAKAKHRRRKKSKKKAGHRDEGESPTTSELAEETELSSRLEQEAAEAAEAAAAAEAGEAGEAAETTDVEGHGEGEDKADEDDQFTEDGMTAVGKRKKKKKKKAKAAIDDDVSRRTSIVGEAEDGFFLSDTDEQEDKTREKWKKRDSIRESMRKSSPSISIGRRMTELYGEPDDEHVQFFSNMMKAKEKAMKDGSYHRKSSGYFTGWDQDRPMEEHDLDHLPDETERATQQLKRLSVLTGDKDLEARHGGLLKKGHKKKAAHPVPHVIKEKKVIKYKLEPKYEYQEFIPDQEFKLPEIGGLQLGKVRKALEDLKAMQFEKLPWIKVSQPKKVDAKWNAEVSELLETPPQSPEDDLSRAISFERILKMPEYNVKPEEKRGMANWHQGRLYAAKYGIHELFGFMISQLLVEQPNKPLDFLINMAKTIDKQNRDRQKSLKIECQRPNYDYRA